jgi:hypothetical protein
VRGVIRIAATAILGMLALSVAGEAASARVVQTIGDTGRERLRYPSDVALGPSGLIYVLDLRTPGPRVLTRVYSPSGRLLRSWPVPGGDAQDIAVDRAGNAYVSALSSDTILKYSPTGQLLARWGATGTGDSQFRRPSDVAIDPAGRVLVNDVGNARVQIFEPDGRFVASWPTGEIYRLAVGPPGTIYASDRQGIVALGSDGREVRRLVRRPGEVVTDPAGTLYARQEHRIAKFGPDGEFLGAVGSDWRSQWTSAAVGSDGSIYVVAARVVLKLAPITTVDLTPPSITVESISRRAVPPPLTYTLSEDASLRISLRSRVPTGRYIHRAHRDEGVTSAGTHRLVLDWRSFGLRGRRRGDFQLVLVARDDAGNESAKARVRFSVPAR